MRLSKIIFTALVCGLTSFSASAQNDELEKADKQYELHAYRQAAKSYEKILAVHTDVNHAAARLADAYRRTNQLSAAAKWYEIAARQPDADPIVLFQYGQVLMSQGIYDRAEGYFKAFKPNDEDRANHFIAASRFARTAAAQPSEYDVKSSFVNSSGDDYGASFYNDQILFSSTRTDMQRAMKKDAVDWTGGPKNQLFTAPLESRATKTAKAMFFKNDLQNSYNEGFVSVAGNQKTVAFTRNNMVEGDRILAGGGHELSIYFAKISPNGQWADVKAYPYNLTGYATGFPSLNYDGNTLYFASDRPGGKGGFDLYVSYNNDGVWSSPVNLGGGVNTPGDEITPFFDGTGLYFSSNYHEGLGGYDVFKSVKKENGWETPVNLGAGVNSMGDDYGFIYDHVRNFGYFNSNRKGGKGNEDIYYVSKPVETVQVVVLNEGTKKVIRDANVKATFGDAHKLTQGKGGIWLVDLSEGGSLGLEISKDSFATQSITVLSTGEKTARVAEVLLKRVGLAFSARTRSFTGNVTDANNNEPIDGVVVTATNQINGAKLSAKSGADGNFNMVLDSNATYVLHYSKEGYVNTHKTVQVGSGKNRDVVGGLSLSPSALAVKSPPVQKTSVRPLPVTESLTTRAPAPRSNVKPVPATAFAIQLAVQTGAASLTPFSHLKSYGKIYSVSEDGRFKIRLGVFKTREAAAATLGKIRDAAKGAFIVKETDETALEKYLSGVQTLQSNTLTPKGVALAPQKQTVPALKPSARRVLPAAYSTIVLRKDMARPAADTFRRPAAIPKIVKEDKTFKVRLAAYKDAARFDATKTVKLGKVVPVKEGAYTVFVIDGFKTLHDAKEIKAKAKTSGFPDAKVVVKSGTVFKVVD